MKSGQYFTSLKKTKDRKTMHLLPPDILHCHFAAILAGVLLSVFVLPSRVPVHGQGSPRNLPEITKRMEEVKKKVIACGTDPSCLQPLMKEMQTLAAEYQKAYESSQHGMTPDWADKLEKMKKRSFELQRNVTCGAYLSARELSGRSFDKLYRGWRCLPAKITISINISRKAGHYLDLLVDYDTEFTGEFNYFRNFEEFGINHPDPLAYPKVRINEAHGIYKTNKRTYTYTKEDARISHRHPMFGFDYQPGAKYVSIFLQSNWIEFVNDQCNCPETSPPQAWITDEDTDRFAVARDIVRQAIAAKVFQKTFEWSEYDSWGWTDRFSVKIKFDVGTKLDSIKVISGATQKNVTGAENWAAVRNPTGDVIVEASTTPNTMAAWKQIQWSGDSGTAVPGKPNQRKLSRATSKVSRLKAALGGIQDELNVWVLGARVTILTKGTIPQNASQFPKDFRDGSQILGARDYVGLIPPGPAAVGKIAAVAQLTPAGVHRVVKKGWGFEREAWVHIWYDGRKHMPGNKKNDKWNTTWVPDSSPAGKGFSFVKLIPDKNDAIYDIDAPNVGYLSPNDMEYYGNYRQWVEWNGEKCSDYAYWHWRGRWQRTANPRVTLKEVGTGSRPLPDKSFFHP